MHGNLKAVVFDMDGVIINSEPLWRKAMIEGFSDVGIAITEDDCRKTMGNRFPEVIAYWLKRYEMTTVDPLALEKRIMSHLYTLIESHGEFIDGIPEIFDFCLTNGIKTGLATSSSHQLMNTVIKKLKLAEILDAVVSAEHMQYGKPHPEVFLSCAHNLGIMPSQCIVIEDSLFGVIAAKAAQMKVVAVPESEHLSLAKFEVADYKLNSMPEVLALFKTLWSDQAQQNL